MTRVQTELISASSVLYAVHQELMLRNPYEEYCFVDPDEQNEAVADDQRVFRVIAEGQDHHRTDTAYMCYDKMQLMTFGNKKQLLGFGHVGGSLFLTRRAVEITLFSSYNLERCPDEERCDFIRKSVHRDYVGTFATTLVVADAELRLGFSSRWGNDRTRVEATMNALKKNDGYDPTSVDTLVRSIETLLSQ